MLTYATGVNANEISICNFDTVFKEVKSDFFKRIWINETVPMDDSFKEILIKLNNSVLNNQE